MAETYGVFRAPRELVFGPGQRRGIARIAARLGKRALVVTDERLAGDSVTLELIASLHALGLAVRLEGGALPDVPVDAVLASAERAREFAPDLIIGLGGGSCLDSAKTIALLLTHGGHPQDYYGENRVPGAILPVIAVPTTAGTGSEVTPVAVLSDASRRLKVGISSPFLIPAAAVCDPELTLPCPKSLTAIAGADALTHALEAFTAIRREATPDLAQDRVFVGKNALSDRFALAAVRLIWENLETAWADPTNLAARSAVMEGAMLAGLAFGVAGTGIAHAVQYPVGALTGTAHGAGVACLMPYVLEWNRQASLPELAELAEVMGLTDGDVAKATGDLFARIGIPPTLAALGLEAKDIDWVAEQSITIARLIQNAARPPDLAQVRALITAAHRGDLAAIAQIA